MLKVFTSVLLLLTQTRAEPLTVCEVLQNLSALNGNNVKVRGVWTRSDSGQSLKPIRPCELQTMRDGWKWRDAIEIVADQDKQSVANFIAEYRRLQKKQQGDVKIYAKLSGRLVTSDHFETFTDPSGMQIPRAFFVFCVAQLRFWGAEDLEAVSYSAAELKEEVERSRRLWPTRIK